METQPTDTGSNAPLPEKKGNSKFFLAGAAVVLALIACLAFYVHNHSNKPHTEDKKEPAFHRDEPVEPQIFQPDYKQKVKEMLDSGHTVREVSKETKIRKDEVRKIKRENKHTRE
jgi:hypothetical protein